MPAGPAPITATRIDEPVLLGGRRLGEARSSRGREVSTLQLLVFQAAQVSVHKLASGRFLNAAGGAASDTPTDRSVP